MARVYSEDAYCLGLLYVYTYSNGMQKMAKLDDLNEFHNTIEQNLKDMQSDALCMYSTMIYDDNEQLYFSSSDKDGNVYYILKPGFDKEKAMSIFIGCLPIKVLAASQMNNALECLGLEKKKDKNIITVKEKKLVKKYINKDIFK
jgi:hypothetical protein